MIGLDFEIAWETGTALESSFGLTIPSVEFFPHSLQK